MPRARSNQLEKLRKYTKDDIVDAIGGLYNADTLVDDIIARIEYNGVKRLLVESEQASKAESAALGKYLAWRTEMAEKYGDGKHVKLCALPSEAIHRGAMLEDKYNKAKKKTQALDRRVDKIMKLSAEDES